MTPPTPTNSFFHEAITRDAGYTVLTQIRTCGKRQGELYELLLNKEEFAYKEYLYNVARNFVQDPELHLDLRGGFKDFFIAVVYKEAYFRFKLLSDELYYRNQEGEFCQVTAQTLFSVSYDSRLVELFHLIHRLAAIFNQIVKDEARLYWEDRPFRLTGADLRSDNKFFAQLGKVSTNFASREFISLLKLKVFKREQLQNATVLSNRLSATQIIYQNGVVNPSSLEKTFAPFTLTISPVDRLNIPYPETNFDWREYLKTTHFQEWFQRMSRETPSNFAHWCYFFKLLLSPSFTREQEDVPLFVLRSAPDSFFVEKLFQLVKEYSCVTTPLEIRRLEPLKNIVACFLKPASLENGFTKEEGLHLKKLFFTPTDLLADENLVVSKRPFTGMVILLCEKIPTFLTDMNYGLAKNSYVLEPFLEKHTFQETVWEQNVCSLINFSFSCSVNGLQREVLSIERSLFTQETFVNANPYVREWYGVDNILKSFEVSPVFFVEYFLLEEMLVIKSSSLLGKTSVLSNFQQSKSAVSKEYIKWCEKFGVPVYAINSILFGKLLNLWSKKYFGYSFNKFEYRTRERFMKKIGTRSAWNRYLEEKKSLPLCEELESVRERLGNVKSVDFTVFMNDSLRVGPETLILEPSFEKSSEKT